MKAAPSNNGKHTIPAVIKAMELVRVLAEEAGETTTKALAIRLGIPRTTCYRILRSLTAKDWVRPLAGGRHELSLGLLPVLNPLRQVEALANAVEPVLETLALQTQLTAKVSVRQGDYAVTIARCESPQETSVAVRIGASFHLAFGSSGAVLLSELKADEVAAILERAPEECWEHQGRDAVARRLRELRVKGWCSDLGTFRASCHAVSAPVRGAQGKVAAAMTVIGFPHEVTPARLP
ncbi:MAG: helix-turn-helix domain-containing protein, partial [Verrucomicrobia bacterium]|nr:helix-turn-helix domain-containing protein [Verrucomicrobiota bacterium]